MGGYNGESEARRPVSTLGKEEPCLPFVVIGGGKEGARAVSHFLTYSTWPPVPPQQEEPRALSLILPAAYHSRSCVIPIHP